MAVFIFPSFYPYYPSNYDSKPLDASEYDLLLHSMLHRAGIVATATHHIPLTHCRPPSKLKMGQQGWDAKQKGCST